MIRLEIHPTRITRLPSGLTVGDEFRIAGRVRVQAMSVEADVDVTEFGKGMQTLPGEMTVALVVCELTASSSASPPPPPPPPVRGKPGTEERGG